MAVAPIDKVEAVVNYALTEIPAEKINMGVPNYGYDWPLPFIEGESRARSLSNTAAVDLARRIQSRNYARPGRHVAVLQLHLRGWPAA